MKTSEVIEHISQAKVGVFETLLLDEADIESLPDKIYELTQLKRLDLHGNKIPRVAKELGTLSGLRVLDLSNNLIQTLPPEIGYLTNLSVLRLGNNQIQALPKQIGNLRNLIELDLSHNKLSALPEQIKRLTKLRTLKLGHNPLPIPPEIIEKVEDPKILLEYYTNAQKLNRKPLHEAKLILVGQGSVGKTSLVRRLIDNVFNPIENKTEGIAIQTWEIDVSRADPQQPSILMDDDDGRRKLNVWDFGGQEIMHATHQFFLTRRSVYVLVLDARLTQEENRVEYWLKLVQSFGGDSPVIIVGNKTDQHPLDIDRTGLRKKYPNIVEIIETSAQTGAGISDLQNAIAVRVNGLPHVRDLLPESWFDIKNALEALGKEENYITYDRYTTICDSHDVVDEASQRTLLEFLHDLGVVLHFQDDPRLEALGILHPQWVTNGVYRILNSHQLFQSQGILTLPLLNEILDLQDYPRDKRLFIVDMMKKFELCYDVEPDKSFLVPDLLPKDEPFTGDWSNSLAFQYHYVVLPPSILTRFIVRMHNFIVPPTWRSGAVLKQGGNNALIKADLEDRKIFIFVSGAINTRRDFLSAIRAELDSIHRTLAKIDVFEKVPLPNQPRIVVDYEHLLKLERKGVTEFIPEGTEEAVRVQELLDGISTENDRRRSEERSRQQSTGVSQPSVVVDDTSGKSQRKTSNNPWLSASLYLFLLIIGASVYFIARALGVSRSDAFAGLGIGAVVVLVIGVLQLKNDGLLDDAAFVDLVREFIKRLSFFSRSK